MSCGRCCYLATTLMGLLALAFSIFTLRYYRSLLPSEIAAVMAGAVLMVAARALLRALRPARFGLTSLPDDKPRHFNLENLDSGPNGARTERARYG